MRGFMAAAQAGFDRHLPVLAAKKKMTIAWNGEHVQQRSCAADMKRLHSICERNHFIDPRVPPPLSSLRLRIGCAVTDTADDSQTLQLIYGNDQRQFNQTLAAFLILRGKFALLQYAVIGPYECAAEPCGKPNSPASGFGPYAWSPMLETDYGEPLGPPTVSAAGVWERKWSKATVSLDCSSWTASFGPADHAPGLKLDDDAALEMRVVSTATPACKRRFWLGRGFQTAMARRCRTNARWATRCLWTASPG